MLFFSAKTACHDTPHNKFNMCIKRVRIITIIRIKFNKILIIISIAQHSRNQKTPLFPPFARGDTGGCKKPFQNLSSGRWEKKVLQGNTITMARKKSAIKKVYSSAIPHIYTFLGKTSLPYYPSKISIESGNLCNLRCPLCPTGQQDKSAKKGFISFNVFKKVVDE